MVEMFKEDLRSILKKYQFQIHQTDHYDSEEEYQASDYYFEKNREVCYSQTIKDILKEAIGEFE